MTRHPVTAFPFQSPKSFYDIGTGAETLKLRPEWAYIKERDMTTAAERIGKYLKTREVYPMKQLGDGIHVVQAGSEWEAELRLSDLLEFHNSHASLVEEVKRLREALRNARNYVNDCAQNDDYFHREEAGYDLKSIDELLEKSNA